MSSCYLEVNRAALLRLLPLLSSGRKRASRPGSWREGRRGCKLAVVQRRGTAARDGTEGNKTWAVGRQNVWARNKQEGTEPKEVCMVREPVDMPVRYMLYTVRAS
jgi:hypothetical protein